VCLSSWLVFFSGGIDGISVEVCLCLWLGAMLSFLFLLSLPFGCWVAELMCSGSLHAMRSCGDAMHACEHGRYIYSLNPTGSDYLFIYYHVHKLFRSFTCGKHPATNPLLAKPPLALLSRNITLLDIANSRRGRSFMQVLHELAQRVLIALCFAGDLTAFSVRLQSSIK